MPSTVTFNSSVSNVLLLNRDISFIVDQREVFLIVRLQYQLLDPLCIFDTIIQKNLQFRKIIIRNRRIGYNLNVQQSACLVFNPIMFDNYDVFLIARRWVGRQTL